MNHQETINSLFKDGLSEFAKTTLVINDQGYFPVNTYDHLADYFQNTRSISKELSGKLSQAIFWYLTANFIDSHASINMYKKSSSYFETLKRGVDISNLAKEEGLEYHTNKLFGLYGKYISSNMQ